MDLARWEALNLTAEATWWMEKHAESAEGLWALGSQPVMHLILYGRWAALPDSWNLDGLGRLTHISQSTLRDAKLLHWTGRRKPWLADGLYTGTFNRHVSKADVRRCAAP